MNRIIGSLTAVVTALVLLSGCGPTSNSPVTVVGKTQSSSVSSSPTPESLASTLPSSSPSPVPTVTVTETVTTTPKPVTPTQAPPKKQPQGTMAIDEWNDLSGTLTCAVVQVFDDNRSDTPILTIRQTFVTSYTPKHAEGQYPALVDGPAKTLSQTVGIPPYTRKEILWKVCAPELAPLQNPPRPDGIDGFLSEIGARPTTANWTWTN